MTDERSLSYDRLSFPGSLLESEISEHHFASALSKNSATGFKKDSAKLKQAINFPDGETAASKGNDIHYPSLLILCYFQLLKSAGVLIVVPTADSYLEALNASTVLSGLLVGLMPAASVVGSFPTYWLSRHGSMKRVFMLAAFGMILGNLLYALSFTAKSSVMLLISRMVFGFFSFGQGPFDWIGRAVSMEKRTSIMLYMAVATLTGYALGPLLAFVLQLATKHINVDNDPVFNQYTAPGWALVFMNIIFAVIAPFVLQEPPKMVNKTAEGKKKKRFFDEFKDVNHGAFFTVMWTCFILATNVTLGDVFIVQNSQNEWGWSIELSALYVGFIMTALIPFCIFAPKFVKKIGLTDRLAIPILYGIGSVMSLFLINYPGLDRITRVTMFSIGAFCTSGFPNIVRGFAMALASKVVPPGIKPITITCGMVCFLLGRTLGASIAPLLDDVTFPYFQLGTSSSVVVFFLLFYKSIVPHEKAE